MSDDIPPLISETPPPMTKLDWEDDEEFLDFPPLTFEGSSESSLSPDGTWNPIGELSLPYDTVIDKPVDCVEPNTKECSSNWPSNIEKDVIKLSSSNSSNEINVLNSKTNIKSNEFNENVIDNKNKLVENDLSLTSEQERVNTKKNNSNITSQCLEDVEFQFNNLELIKKNDTYSPETKSNTDKLFLKETLINDHLKCVEVEEILNETNCVQNVLESLKNDISDINVNNNTSNGFYETTTENVLIKNNNNIAKIDHDEYTDFCDFETTKHNSSNVLLPNTTFHKNNEVIENSQTVNENLISDQIIITPLNDSHNIPENNSIPNEKIFIQNANYNSSILKNQHNIETVIEDNIDSEFDDFSDFHSFPTSTFKNQDTVATIDDDFCDFEKSTSIFNNTVNVKHSNTDQREFVKSNDNNDSNYTSYKSNSQINTDTIDNDFESGCSKFSTYTMSDVKQNDVLFSSEPQLDYKQFCKEIFQGDYELCEEVDLLNLDDVLNDSQVWLNLKDVESSPALNYNWSKSELNNVFLSSLSIDSRNILFGASWNPKVPRFAANMSNNPLEPLKASNNDTKISQSFGPLQETVPDPEFDWKSSGLINPLDCNHTSLLDLELLDTLAPCCTNTLQPQSWKTTDAVKEVIIKEEPNKEPVQISPESVDVTDTFFGDSSSYDNHVESTVESPCMPEATVSLEAQMILDNLPDFEVLQKPYLVILDKENYNLFIN